MAIRSKKPKKPDDIDMVGPAFPDPGRRGRRIVIAGVIMAVAAGLGSFVFLQRAQVATNPSPKIAVVVAARTIAARKPIERDDLILREMPIDPTNAQGIFDDPAKLINRVPGVTILQGQLVTSNLFTMSNTLTGEITILAPDETVTSGSPAWRAVSLNVPDDRAVAGLLQAGARVDVVVTASVIVPQKVLDQGTYYPDKSSKITYQDIPVLAKSGTMYVVKVNAQAAEEIAHLQASGNVSFTLALRPTTDSRVLDPTLLGQTMNAIIQRYGLPIPQVFPGSGAAMPAAPVLPPAAQSSPAFVSSPPPVAVAPSP